MAVTNKFAINRHCPTFQNQKCFNCACKGIFSVIFGRVN